MQRSFKPLLIINQTRILEQTLSSITEDLRAMDNLALSTLYQKGIIRIMDTPGIRNESNFFIENYQDAISVRTQLSQMIGPEAIPYRIILFTRYYDFIEYGWQPINNEYIRGKYNSGEIDTIADYIDSMEGSRVIVPLDDDLWYNKTDQPVISLFRELRDLNHHYGYINIQAPASIISDKLQSNLPGTVFILRDERGNVIYNSSPERHYSQVYNFNRGKNLTIDDSIQSIEDKQQGKPYYVMSEKSEYSGWTLNLYQDAATFLHPVRELQFTYLVFSAVLFLLGTMIVKFASHILTKPLKQLHESIYQVNLQNLRITLEEKDSHHIVKQINSSFQIMFKRLQDAVDKELQSQENELKAHMAALQNQMNPHLLYNMLSHISNLASEDKTEKIEEICQRLSRSLRYLGQTDSNPVPLANELNHLNDYLNLMKSHYEPLFDFTFPLPQDGTDLVFVPKLILQPIAENSFNHGFQNVSPPWNISVHIELNPSSSWKIIIEDNGCGVSEEKRQKIRSYVDLPLEQLRSEAINRPPGGLALMNIIARLRFIYGNDMVFDLDSGKGYTRVALGGSCVQNPHS